MTYSTDLSSSVCPSDGYDSVAEDDYILEDLPDGKKRYVGSHGDFIFDPDEFEVTAMDSEASEFCCGGRSHIIRYVGNETDGSKIRIPDGLTDGTCMFMNTDITFMPKLPMSLKFGDAMFMGTKLTSVYQGSVNPVTKRTVLPPGLRSTSFMFANCRDLEIGPMDVPPLVKNADFMFADCGRLVNTPRLSYGLRYGDAMFAGCHSLTEKPRKPSSMKSSESMTYDCPMIDAAEDRKAALRIQKDREAFERKVNRPTFRQKMGSAFTCMMQVHLMRQMGYGMVMAPLMTHMMRKNGVFHKDFTRGASQVFSSSHNGMSRMIGKKIGKMGSSYGEKLESKRRDQLERWDSIHKDAGAAGTHVDKSMAYLADQDYFNGMFHRMSNLNSGERHVIEERFSAHCEMREQFLSEKQLSGKLTEKDKQTAAKWYVEQISGCASYYAEGKRMIGKGSVYPKDSDKAFARSGLDEISRIQLDELIASAESVQASYQIFSDKDLRMITNLISDLPSERGKTGTFAQRNRSGQDVMADKTRGGFARTGSEYRAYRERERRKSGTVSRGEQAAQRFGRMASDFAKSASDKFMGMGE